MKLRKRKTNRKTKKKMKNKKGGSPKNTLRKTAHATVRHATTRHATATRTTRQSGTTPSKTLGNKTLKAVKKTHHLPSAVKNTLFKQTLKCDRNIHVLSGKIYWLSELAGDKHVMTEIGKIWGSDKVKRLEVLSTKIPNKGDYKETMYFKSGGKSGHWIYFDKKGQMWNSYDLNHQEQGTNQFCQTFCLLYMIHDHWASDALYPDWSTQLIPGDYVNNIKVVVKFWKYLFNYEPEFTQMLIDELVDINNEFITENEGETRESRLITLIAENSDEIDLNLINKKLKDIDDCAFDIADVVK